MELTELIARTEIYDALIRYCRGIDRAMPELAASAFHDDAVDDHGIGRVFSPREMTETSAQRKWAKLPRVSQHLLTNWAIVIRGDRANCESSWLVVTPGPGGYAVSGGRYLDRFEKRDGSWRIARRKVVCDWSRNCEDFEAFPEALTMPAGSLGADDPAFGFLEELAGEMA